jgi:hypothetical protein
MFTVGPVPGATAGAAQLSGLACFTPAASPCEITAGIACRTRMFTSWPTRANSPYATLSTLLVYAGTDNPSTTCRRVLWRR